MRCSSAGPRGWAGALLLAEALVVALAGCGPRVLVVERSPQAYYQTSFPTHDLSSEIEEAFRSLQRVTYSGEYETYVFSPDAGVTEADLGDEGVLAGAVERHRDVQSRAATAVVVARSDRGAVLVTNEHVVRFPRLRVHFLDEDRERRRGSRRVIGVSVLVRERGYLAQHTALGEFEVLARDSANDLAILEVRFPSDSDTHGLVPLPAPTGDPHRLSWGSFVYVLGYPNGYPMVTRAIVSDPDRDHRGSFLTDGLWNEGISGGAILAVRGEDGSLEWVGVARAGAGTREVRLQPAAWEAQEDEASVLYEGRVYAESVLRIQYGITLSVPVTSVRSLLEEQRPLLQRRGYQPVGF